MAHEVVVGMLMRLLVIAGADEVGALLAAIGLYAAGVSARNNAAKILKGMVDLGRLESGPGYYRVPGCQSSYGEHAKLLTQAIVKILIKFPNSLINREIAVPIGLRPDALVMLVRDNQSCVFVLEVMNKERENYFQDQKVKKWNEWAGALEFLSQTFGCQVPHFSIVRSDQLDKFLEQS